MTVSCHKIGKKVIAKVIEVNDDCFIGMKVGDEFELSIHRCGDFCGYFYHNIFNWISTLQFGGSFPMDEQKVVQDCYWCEPRHIVKIELTRSEE